MIYVVGIVFVPQRKVGTHNVTVCTDLCHVQTPNTPHPPPPPPSPPHAHIHTPLPSQMLLQAHYFWDCHCVACCVGWVMHLKPQLSNMNEALTSSSIFHGFHLLSYLPAKIFLDVPLLL